MGSDASNAFAVAFTLTRENKSKSKRKRRNQLTVNKLKEETKTLDLFTGGFHWFFFV